MAISKLDYQLCVYHAAVLAAHQPTIDDMASKIDLPADDLAASALAVWKIAPDWLRSDCRKIVRQNAGLFTPGELRDMEPDNNGLIWFKEPQS